MSNVAKNKINGQHTIAKSLVGIKTGKQDASQAAEFTLCWLNYFLLKVAYHFFLMRKYFKNFNLTT